jgi:hypothetical protein
MDLDPTPYESPKERRSLTMTPKRLLRIVALPAVALLGAGGCGDSTSDTVEVDTTPPSAPSSLALAPDESSLTITWAANSEADLAGYVLERSLDRGQTWAPVSETVLTESSWVDTLRGRADYRVAAVDLSDNQSAYSDTATWIAPSGGPGKIPANPAS